MHLGFLFYHIVDISRGQADGATVLQRGDSPIDSALDVPSTGTTGDGMSLAAAFSALWCAASSSTPASRNLLYLFIINSPSSPSSTTNAGIPYAYEPDEPGPPYPRLCSICDNSKREIFHTLHASFAIAVHLRATTSAHKYSSFGNKF
jgi:hypothetical protein